MPRVEPCSLQALSCGRKPAGVRKIAYALNDTLSTGIQHVRLLCHVYTMRGSAVMIITKRLPVARVVAYREEEDRVRTTRAAYLSGGFLPTGSVFFLRWQHLYGAYDGSRWTLYVDGAQTDQTDFTDFTAFSFT
eukprot:522970-Pyramimonas_sp.AAC.2